MLNILILDVSLKKSTSILELVLPEAIELNCKYHRFHYQKNVANQVSYFALKSVISHYNRISSANLVSILYQNISPLLWRSLEVTPFGQRLVSKKHKHKHIAQVDEICLQRGLKYVKWRWPHLVRSVDNRITVISRYFINLVHLEYHWSGLSRCLIRKYFFIELMLEVFNNVKAIIFLTRI